MKFKYRLIFFFIGLLGIGLMIWQTDFSSVDWKSLIEPKALLLFVGIMAVWVLIYFLHAIAYKIILKEDSKNVKMYRMYRICLAGFALNNVTPAGLIGGEPYRIMALRRYVPTERATSSTLTFSIFYALGHFMLWVTGTVLYIVYGCPGPLWVTIILIIAGVLLFAVVVWSFFARNIGFVYPFMRLIAKIPLLRRKTKPLVEKNKESYIRIDDNIRAFRNEGWRYWAVILLEYTSRLLEAFEYFMLLQFFVGAGTSVSYFDGILIMSTASLVGNILFIIPMQAGSREFGTSLALGFIGISSAVFAPMAIVYRIRELTYIIIGIILVLVGRKYKPHAQVMQELQEKAEHEKKEPEKIEEQKPIENEK